LQTNFVEKIETHFIFNNFLFRKSRCLWDNFKKWCTPRQATDDNMAQAHYILDR